MNVVRVFSVGFYHLVAPDRSRLLGLLVFLPPFLWIRSRMTVLFVCSYYYLAYMLLKAFCSSQLIILIYGIFAAWIACSFSSFKPSPWRGRAVVEKWRIK